MPRRFQKCFRHQRSSNCTSFIGDFPDLDTRHNPCHTEHNTNDVRFEEKSLGPELRTEKHQHDEPVVAKTINSTTRNSTIASRPGHVVDRLRTRVESFCPLYSPFRGIWAKCLRDSFVVFRQTDHNHVFVRGPTDLSVRILQPFSNSGDFHCQGFSLAKATFLCRDFVVDISGIRYGRHGPLDFGFLQVQILR